MKTVRFERHEGLGHIVLANPPKNLIATHFSSRYDGRQIAQIADEAKEVFERITLGRDLLEIDL